MPRGHRTLGTPRNYEHANCSVANGLNVCVAGRPIDKRLQKKSKLPKVKKAWTVEDRLGGWDKSQKQFFGGGVRA